MILPISLPAVVRRFTTAAAGASVPALAFSLLASPLAPAQETLRFYVREYRVEGAKRLKNLEVEEAVYPYLGPARSPDDVEQARQALEKVYHDKGYPNRVRLHPPAGPAPRHHPSGSHRKQGRPTPGDGARWFLPSRIKAEVPSLAEGSVPNFNRFPGT
jgi:hypothetical protein